MDNPISNSPNRLLKDTSALSWRDNRYLIFYNIVDHIVSEIQQHKWSKTGKRKRRVGKTSLGKLHYSVECIVRDCVAVILQRKRKVEASIRRGQYAYSASNPDKMLTYSIHIERAFNGMSELGYLEITKSGYWIRDGQKGGAKTSRLTRYVASDKLLNHFTSDELLTLPAIIPAYDLPSLIRVRITETDEKSMNRKKSVPVIESDECEEMRQNLRIINKALKGQWDDLELLDDELSNLQSRLSSDPSNERTIRMDRRFLYRVFNDQDLKTGGRFYGGWWQNIPREYRIHLTVNGKPMIEVDYSNQHPTILYAKEGVERPLDCYANVIEENQLVKGSDPVRVRNMVKASFNAMINSSKTLKQAPNGVKPRDFGLTWRQVSDAILKFHQPIERYFYSGIGLQLQRLDSDIAEQVMLHFANIGYPILPLHDSFLMHHAFEDQLPSVMKMAFQKIVGVEPKVDLKQRTQKSEISEPLKIIELDFDEILKASNVGHERRLDAFRQLNQSN